MRTEFVIEVASKKHVRFAEIICRTMEESALARGTGISRRLSQYIAEKIRRGDAVVATSRTGDWAGFSYFDRWDGDEFVSNSGLIVSPHYRNAGLASQIKQKLFKLCRRLFPKSKLFSITTGHTVMKLNSALGFEPVPFSELPKEERFWAGCESCCHCDILKRTNHRFCLCTDMLYEPKTGGKKE